MFHAPSILIALQLAAAPPSAPLPMPKPVPPAVLDLAMQPPKIITDPGPEYSDDARDYAMVIGMDRTPRGRLWAAWVAGGDSDKGLFVAATSDDGGTTWSAPRLVIDPPDVPDSPEVPGGLRRRILVGNFWTDPTGKLWLFFDQSMGYYDGRAGSWAITCDNPDDEKPLWSAPRRIWHGATLNKPLVLKNGEWLMPISLWPRRNINPAPLREEFHELDHQRMAHLFVSTDEGKTWTRRGGVVIPDTSFDEHMYVELPDGRLWMLARTTYGIAETFSSDQGATWSAPQPSAIKNVSARFFLRRLKSGRLLLVKNGPLDERLKSRSHLTAFLSDDDGKIWRGGLVIDERNGVSYPDGFQAPDGVIHIIHDHNRAADREILLAKFTEDDVLAGKFVSPGSQGKILVNKARGGLPKPTKVSAAAAPAPIAKPQIAATADAAPQFFPHDPRALANYASSRLLTDMSRAQPAEALTTGPRDKGKWKVISYAAEGFEGKALSVFRYTGAAPIRLPLEAKGWHAVFIGLGTVSGGLDNADDNGLRVKLSGERVFKRMSNGLPLMKPRRDVVQEIYLTTADLKGQSLDIEMMPLKPANVCYVRLVPLDDDEVAAWRRFMTDDSHRTAIVTFDGHSWIWPYAPRTAEHLLENFRGLEGTDVKKWWFQVLGADLTCYPTQVGSNPGEVAKDFYHPGHEEFTRSLNAMFAAGVHPLKVAREEAARQGSEFHVMIRPAGWGGALPFEEIFNSKFFNAHPEWRCVDRDGTPTLFMSYAYPEVRKHVIDVLRENMALKPDGVGFLFHRGMPMILWEQPFCDEFRRHYSADARTVAEDDPRILELRAEMMTGLIREVRAMLDEEQKKAGDGRRMKISMSTFAKETDNRKFGLDVARWAREGLVDDLAVAYFAHHTSFGALDLKYYRRVVEGTKTGLYPFVIAWHSGSPQQLCAKVSQFYDEGATGISVWDPEIQAKYRDRSPGNVFDIASRVGHREWMKTWAKRGPPQPPQLPLTRWADNHYSRWFPNTGF